ncbi:hypothetical protein SAMN05216229_105206 [Geopseudomonas sagittaria]|uniref:Uncharacterized protein n=1 Tax=Geopseudomonas sagittaria TaxID=1135990 RepID=A0A1I5T095_9GAMM|nr:polysialyltransferase family glycosyltransferase [Pseudomonas sagittaria]SFP76484.1 hypothetical protein SAMN05216229_105206 [Pseudomonas sagittaria]
MKIVVVCQTALHFLLASVLLAGRSGEKIFVWVEESDIDEVFVEEIVAASEARIIRLRGAAKLSGKILRTLRKMLNVRGLRKERVLGGCSELIVFNDLMPETQCLINAVGLSSGKVCLGEDGVALYEIGGRVHVNVASRLAGKFLYGYWWEPKERIGEHKGIKTIYAAMPGLIRASVSEARDVHNLPAVDPGFFSSVLHKSYPEFSCIDNSVLCVLPLSSIVKPGNIIRLLEALGKQGKILIIKFHPRESEQNISEILKDIRSSSYVCAPKNIPAELLCMGRHPPSMVVGYKSSALHIIKSLMPDICLRYYEPLMEEGAIGWRDFYNKNGINEYVF